MKKVFSLTSPKHAPPRVVASIKADVRKYIKRERKKELPEGVDFWDFDCRAGKDAETAVTVHVAEITQPIDAAAEQKWDGIYLEILAKPGHRAAKPKED